MAQEYDLVVLGGGTGGYVAAIRAAQLGLKTAVVEKEKLGGTCLHNGCIPSKALLRSAEVYRMTRDEAAKFGVAVEHVTLQFSQVQARKRKIVAQLHQGVEALLKKWEIDVLKGTGRILGPSIFSPMPGTISVEQEAGSENIMLIPKNIIIATGSRPREIEGINVDGLYVMNSNDALNMETLPSSILIIGGGVIGVEWASLLCDFGVAVTIVENGPRILLTEDEEISKEITRLLEKRGVRIIVGATVLVQTYKNNNGSVYIEAQAGEEKHALKVERILFSIGRQANIEGIGLENTEIELENGYIKVRDSYQTKESHIYAIGDCIGGLQLAHVASHEGIAAVEHIVSNKVNPVDPMKIARCVYSYPEIASIGLTETQAREQGLNAKIGKFPFKGIGKALVYGETDGFVKVIVDDKTDDVIGIHMIGPHVTDLIGEAALATVLDATPWEIGQTIHPHPSLSEVLGEAALAVDGKAIHF